MSKKVYFLLLLSIFFGISCSSSVINDTNEIEDIESTDDPIAEESSESGESSPNSGSGDGDDITNERGGTDEDTDEGEENIPVGFSKNLNVLFVGNSLTYFNDLPRLVREEGNQKDISLKTTMVAFPNYAIIDHWEDGDVQELIAGEEYDFVIIQQGPSSQTFGRQVLFEYGKKFKDLCETYDSKLVYFMVWPDRAYYHTFDDVIKNHRDASEANMALLSPVGEVWKRDIEFTKDYSYYGEDNFHPSLKGSKVAARVIGETIFNN